MMKLKALGYVSGLCLLLCAMVACNKTTTDLPAAAAAVSPVGFCNLIPYQGAINFYVNGTRQNSSKLNYGDFSGYIFSNIPSGPQVVSFKTDTTTAHLDVYSGTLTLDSLQSTLFVTGKLNKADVIQVRDTAVADTKNLLPKVRFINASADAPALDLVLNNVTIANKAYKTISAFSRADTGKVAVTLKPTGGSTIIYSRTITLLKSGVYTMYTYGSYAGGTNSITLGIVVNH